MHEPYRNNHHIQLAILSYSIGWLLGRVGYIIYNNHSNRSSTLPVLQNGTKKKVGLQEVPMTMDVVYAEVHQ